MRVLEDGIQEKKADDPSVHGTKRVRVCWSGIKAPIPDISLYKLHSSRSRVKAAGPRAERFDGHGLCINPVTSCARVSSSVLKSDLSLFLCSLSLSTAALLLRGALFRLTYGFYSHHCPGNKAKWAASE